MPQIATNKKYTLTSPFIGPDNNLASTLDADRVIVESADLKASQQWYFTSTPIDGYYFFQTSQKGDNYTLDVGGYDGVDPLSIHFYDIDKEGKLKGQLWAIGEWSDGSARISNNYTGSDLLLDVEKADEGYTASLANADEKKEGQKWSFAVVGADASQSLSATTLATATRTSGVSTGTGTPTGKQSSETPSSTSTSAGGEGHKGLSKAAIGGVSVAGIVGAAFLITAAVILWKKLNNPQGRGRYSAPMEHLPRARLNN